jgi:hypothetical protein
VQHDSTPLDDDLKSLLKRSFRPRTDAAADAVQSAVSTLLTFSRRNQVTVTEDAMQTIEQIVAEIDRKLSAQLTQIMHSPSFQRVEGAWRGLHYLVNSTDTTENLKIRYLNISKKELNKTLRRYKGVEALAQRIHCGAVPPALAHARVWSLDIAAMQAGASARGEFEQRLRAVIDAVIASPGTTTSTPSLSPRKVQRPIPLPPGCAHGSTAARSKKCCRNGHASPSPNSATTRRAALLSSTPNWARTSVASTALCATLFRWSRSRTRS